MENTADVGKVPTRQEAFDDLMSTTCSGCDGPKQSAKSHCRKCYFSLPGEARRNLYRKIGYGYEQALADSPKILARIRNRKDEDGSLFR
jgi:DnaJ-class molecular chaperone